MGTQAGLKLHMGLGRVPSYVLAIPDPQQPVPTLPCQELKEVGKEQPRVEAEHPANTTKNRYPHVLPCECWEREGTGQEWH